MMASNGSENNTILNSINEIGNPQTSETSETSEMRPLRQQIEQIKQKKLNWITGGLVSLFPVLLIGILRFVFLEASLETIVSVLTNTSIMYTGISLMVSANNDLDLVSERERRLSNTYMFLLVIFVGFYSGIEAFSIFTGDPISNTQSILKTLFIVILNFSFVAVPARIGWRLQYGESLKRLKSEDQV